ncbi:hypothetical protein [Actinospongicola halichondriae]|uniref:hypothetical protein n=1 Tax=Actinospongicola halichondriae TaxID=3236844 RepID=UPI003D3FB82C
MTAPGATDRDVVGELARIGYARARRLLIGVGIAILAVVVAGLLARSVDHVEVIGTLLFVPIFVALMFWGVAGGAVAGIAATVAYVVLRSDAIDAVGWGEFAGVVVSRGLGYLLFGVAGGWASSTLELSLDKLDLHDTIDDQTGVHNARFLINDVGLERARAERYQTVFSVSFVEIPAAEIDALPARRRRHVLRDLGQQLDGGVRTIDRVAHGHDGRTHHVATILPETAEEGATIFHARLLERIREFLRANDVEVVLSGEVCTVPGRVDALEARLETWRRIDALEHATT